MTSAERLANLAAKAAFHDAPLVSPGSVQAGGTPFAIPAGAWDNTGIGGAAGGAQNGTGSAIFLVIRAGVVSDPDENGHIYLEIAPNNNNGARPVAGWLTCDYVAARNNQAAGTGLPSANGGGSVGVGVGLKAFVPVGWWYRLRVAVIASYNAPEWILDGANAGFFQVINP